jgi:enhancer of polycomb-like protein
VSARFALLVDLMLCSYLRHNMTLFSEKDHAQLLKDSALTVVNAEGRAQVLLPYRLGAFQPQPCRRDAQTVVRQGPSTMNGAPVAQQLSVAPLNGTAVSNQHQIKTMAPPVLGPQMRISSNGGLRPPVVPATNVQSNGNTHDVAPPQLIPIPVSQHSPASRAAIAMPHVDAQKLEVIVTPAVSNSAMSTSQLDANTELSPDSSPGRPKAPDPTPQHGFSVHTNGFHLTPMINMTTPTINSSFGQNHYTGGLSLQQMQNLKTAFANIPAPDLVALQNVGRAISASYKNIAVNGTNMNMQLPANMKMSPARQMQRAMNSASFQKPASGENGTDGQLNGSSMITAGNTMSSSPSMLRSPLASDVRTPSRNGIHVSGQRSLTPHAQPTSSPLLNGTKAQSSPRPSMASTAGMSSSSLQQQQQQAVKTTQNGF